MATDETYNGWSNRETWALMLHINNDEGLQSDALALVATAMQSEYPHSTAQDGLRYWVDSLLTPDGYEDEYGMPWTAALQRVAGDVGSLWRINWRECADALAADGEDR